MIGLEHAAGLMLWGFILFDWFGPKRWKEALEPQTWEIRMASCILGAMTFGAGAFQVYVAASLGFLVVSIMVFARVAAQLPSFWVLVRGGFTWPFHVTGGIVLLLLWMAGKLLKAWDAGGKESECGSEQKSGGGSPST